MKPIAVYTISNTMSVQVFEIDKANDTVLAGKDADSAEWCNIYYTPIHEDMTEEDTPYFVFGEMCIPLGECIRI
jgi:hypothetical protein